MKRKVLLLVAVASVASLGFAPSGAATAPEDVTITIVETFHTDAPFVTGAITATDGVFGAGTSGTLASVGFDPHGFAVKFPPQDHVFVYTAEDHYTFADGTFNINFQASCNIVSFDEQTGDFVNACAGNWQVNGGTGSYSRLKGAGTFIETQALHFDFSGTGFITLVGGMHVD